MASTSRRPRTSRSAARRTLRRNPGARRGAAPRPWLRRLPARDRGAVLVVTALALFFVGDYLRRHPAVLAALLVLLGLAATAAGYFWGRRWYRALGRAGRGPLPSAIDEWRALSPGGFEVAVARLCRRDGCSQVTVLGGAGDRAGDVKARTPDGRWLLVQCKRYGETNKVGAEVLYQVNGTYRETHQCDTAAVVTTSTFTASAVDWNTDLDAPLRLFGSRQLLDWAAGTGPAPWQ
ncbi:restriction endonuclease [Streptomyces sp. NPDC058084]|uniref:restriction endonuclease n=1 Tax=Streptomyces sp. NPDC058084 TaxID=3346333 RepID=UPI0036EA5D4B